MSSFAFRFSLIVFTSALVIHSQRVFAAEKPDIPGWINLLNDPDQNIRQKAAVNLAGYLEPRIAKAVKKRIKEEKDFGVQLSLHYALALQGNRSSVQTLINSLNQKDYPGLFYLRRVTSKNYGWNSEKWQSWFNTTTDEEFQKIIIHHWHLHPRMDEKSEFFSLYTRRYIGEEEGMEEVLKAIGWPEKLSEAEKKKLETLPTAIAWKLYSSAIREKFRNEGNRKEAARLLHKVATEYPQTWYARFSQEWADLLDKMVLEDQKFKPAEDIKSLPMQEQIQFHIYQLRNLVAYQFSHPGAPDIFNNIMGRRKDGYNPAISLVKIGEPAVPYVLELLEDQRPIRAVYSGRSGFPEIGGLLRYQDAAFGILCKIRSNNLYDQRLILSYRKEMAPETKKKIIKQFIASGKEDSATPIKK